MCYFYLQYPDLAAGEAYKALLLADAVADESDEYHGRAREAVEEWLVQRDEEGKPTSRSRGSDEDEDSRTDAFVNAVCVPTV